MRVLLTHSAGKLEGLETALLASGLEVDHTPFIKTTPLTGSTTKQQTMTLLPCPWLFFTSRSAVSAWHSLGLPFNKRATGTALIGAVGRQTAAEVQRLDGTVSLIAEPATAAGLLHEFYQHPLAASPVGLPQGDLALPTLANGLAARGFQSVTATLYQTQLQSDTDKIDDADLIVLASPSAVAALQTPPDRVKLVAIGPSTAAAIAAKGWSCTEAARPDIAAIMETIEALRPTGDSP